MKFSIYDKSIYEQLIAPLIKEAQPTAILPHPQGNKVNLSTAKVFVDRLYKDIKGIQEPDISTSSNVSGTPTNLKSTDLYNFGRFLNSLYEKKVTVDGKQVVFLNQDEIRNIPDEVKNKELGIISSDMLGEDYERGDNRKIFTERFIVNGPALRKLLSKMKEDVENPEKGIPNISRAYINSMILDFNNVFRQLKLDPVKSGPTSTFDEISDDTVIDQISQKTFNLDDINKNTFTFLDVSESGNLTAGDIKSKVAFNAWLGNNTIIIVNKKQSYLGHDLSKVQEYKCKILSILIYRASYLKNNARSEEDKVKYIYYYNQIRKLASQFGCESSSSFKNDEEDGASVESTKSDKSSGDSDKVSLTGDQRNRLAHITSKANLPLSRLEIDIDRILDFAYAYTNFLNALNNSTALIDVNRKLSLINKYKAIIDNKIMKRNQPFTVLNLGVAPEIATVGMKNLADFKNYIGYLKKIVLYASEIVRNLDKHYGDKLPSNIRNNLQAQFGSILSRNINQLSYFSNAFKQKVLPKND